MTYRFVIEYRDYSDYASGRVLYNLPGHPAFPIRLASEIFQRCLEFRRKVMITTPVILYDPCCGSAYSLAVLAFFHWEAIAEIFASDINKEALSVAERNLSLLTPDGLERRVQELAQLKILYGKPSHDDAMASALFLQESLAKNIVDHPISTHLFQADIHQPTTIFTSFGEQKADVVITDIPYGRLSSWQGATEDGSPTSQMLTTLVQVLSDDAVVAIVSTKREKIAHPDYLQIRRLKLGLRLVTFLKLRPPHPVWFA